jgi:hypothetical protein
MDHSLVSRNGPLPGLNYDNRESHPETGKGSYRGTISYHTIDPVNLATLRALAARQELDVEHREPRDGLGNGPLVLIDADLWWTDHHERQQGLEALVQRAVRPPVLALHGWQLSAEQIAWLDSHGFLVSNQLDAPFIAELARRWSSLPPLPRPLPRTK